MNQYADPFHQFEVVIPNPMTDDFVPDHDRFLFCCMVRLGYGNWELIQQAIQQCPQFRFDWFFRMQTASALQHRCDLIIKAIQKEHASETRGRGNRKHKDSDLEDLPKRKRSEDEWGILDLWKIPISLVCYYNFKATDAYKWLLPIILKWYRITKRS